VLGDHVAQKGSLVAPDRLRFDFSHPKPVTAEELERVEDIANDIVLQNSSVTTRLMALDDARASGARALFGEKYGDEVRVVAMGDGTSGSLGNTLGWSVELCGGTHVKRTGDIGLITGLSDSGVAAGVRRLEALTGRAARKTAAKQLQAAKAASAELKVPLEEMPARISALMDERKKLERELSDAKRKLAMGGGASSDGGGSDIETISGVKVLAKSLNGVDAKDLRGIADEGKKKLGSGVVVLVANDAEGKAALVVGVTPDLTGANNAVTMVQAGVAVLGGKGGGGRPDMAQGGGPNGGEAQAAIAAVKKLVKSA
jgi:alanyl-tRNA synthetase